MDGKNRELTSEEEAAELAKPGAHPEWETNLPADLQKAVQDYLEGIRNQVTYLDCLWDELYGSINAELDYALARLYEKTVPPTVREFLEDTGTDGDSPQNF